MIGRLIPLALIVAVVLACASTRPDNALSPRNNDREPGGSPTPKSSGWGYSEYKDEMGRGTIYLTSIQSSNTISLGFPYEGAQRGTLSVREHPQHGRDVFLSIQEGQLLDSQFHGRVLVRFDDDKPISFPSVRPADLSSDTLFLRGNAFPVFLSRLKTAKTVRIEAPVYQAGNQILEFDVEGFTWKK